MGARGKGGGHTFGGWRKKGLAGGWGTGCGHPSVPEASSSTALEGGLGLGWSLSSLLF